MQVPLAKTSQTNVFDLSGQVVVITGAAGLLGKKHAEAVAQFGAIPILLDVDSEGVEAYASDLSSRFGVATEGKCVDITQEEAVKQACAEILKIYGRIDVLINNAALNPTMSDVAGLSSPTRLENFSIDLWDKDIRVGLTGALICTKVFGVAMAEANQGGSIINIASDLALVGPDQGLYEKEGLDELSQPVKPVSYSVVKSGLIGLTKYTATYWAKQGIRCNALCPGGVENNQDPILISRIEDKIPMGRMANADEYQGAIVFLASDASRYMTGSVLVMDGGRTAW